jgi:hypothetical protein
MLQLLMAAQKGQLNKTDDEDVGTIGEDAADSELHKKHMSSKKGDALSNINFIRHATINGSFVYSPLQKLLTKT